MGDSLSPEERVIQAMEKTANLYNMNESYARLYGTVYFDDEMTLDKLSKKTGLSKSTVSRGMNALEDMYLVHSAKKDGHGKTKFYSAEKNLEAAMMKLMENEATKEVEIMTEALNKAEQEFRELGDDEGVQKVNNLQNFYYRAEKFVGLMKKMPSGSFDRLYRALKKMVPVKN